VCAGGLFLQQPPPLLDSIGEYLRGLDSWQLTCLDGAVRPLKSLVLGTAVLERWLSAEEAVQASRLEEAHQAYSSAPSLSLSLSLSLVCLRVSWLRAGPAPHKSV
jgi:chaperone required for assembly of F1-ATPase